VRIEQGRLLLTDEPVPREFPLVESSYTLTPWEVYQNLPDLHYPTEPTSPIAGPSSLSTLSIQPTPRPIVKFEELSDVSSYPTPPTKEENILPDQPLRPIHTNPLTSTPKLKFKERVETFVSSKKRKETYTSRNFPDVTLNFYDSHRDDLPTAIVDVSSVLVHCRNRDISSLYELHIRARTDGELHNPSVAGQQQQYRRQGGRTIPPPHNYRIPAPSRQTFLNSIATACQREPEFLRDLQTTLAQRGLI